MKLTNVMMSAVLLFTASMATRAEGTPEGLLDLQEAWAAANYQTPPQEQKQAFNALEERADALIVQNPGRVEPMIWKAIVLSTEAGIVGGFGALSKAKSARDLLLRAEAIQPDALNGSIYTSLGSLYYKVPGWPIGFGDRDKAESYLKKALALNADGIDPNYFYADFLFESGHYEEARQYAEHALAAPLRAGRPVADAGRRQEVSALMEKLDHKLAASGTSGQMKKS